MIRYNQLRYIEHDVYKYFANFGINRDVDFDFINSKDTINVFFCKGVKISRFLLNSNKKFRRSSIEKADIAIYPADFIRRRTEQPVVLYNGKEYTRFMKNTKQAEECALQMEYLFNKSNVRFLNEIGFSKFINSGIVINEDNIRNVSQLIESSPDIGYALLNTCDLYNSHVALYILQLHHGYSWRSPLYMHSVSRNNRKYLLLRDYINSFPGYNRRNAPEFWTYENFEPFIKKGLIDFEPRFNASLECIGVNVYIFLKEEFQRVVSFNSMSDPLVMKNLKDIIDKSRKILNK